MVLVSSDKALSMSLAIGMERDGLKRAFAFKNDVPDGIQKSWIQISLWNTVL